MSVSKPKPLGGSCARQTERAAVALRAIVEQLPKGDDCFITHAEPKVFDQHDTVKDASGRVLARIRRTSLLGWIKREWVQDYGGEAVVTPAGFEAVRKLERQPA